MYDVNIDGARKGSHDRIKLRLNVLEVLIIQGKSHDTAFVEACKEYRATKDRSYRI